MPNSAPAVSTPITCSGSSIPTKAQGDGLLPWLYAIVDSGCFADTSALLAFGRELNSAGVTLLQYRNKSGNARQMLSHGRELRRLLPDATLIMNDRADLCLAAHFNGVHLGQDDLTVEGARAVVGQTLWVGFS